MKRRKRHIVVDTQGLLLAVAVHPASIQDRDGAKLVLSRLVGRFPRLAVHLANIQDRDGAMLVQWAKEVGGWSLGLVRRSLQLRTFQVLSRSWVCWNAPSAGLTCNGV